MVIAIEVKGLVKVYDGKVRALDGVDLRVEAGNVFALLGPNGSGKTTLMRILTTQFKPTSGEASILGFDVVRRDSEVRKVILDALEDMGLDEVGNNLVKTYSGGTTIFFNTHYMDEADLYSDEIAIIDRGKMVRFGTAKELKHSLKREVIQFSLIDHIVDENFVKSIRDLDCVSDRHHIFAWRQHQ